MSFLSKSAYVTRVIYLYIIHFQLRHKKKTLFLLLQTIIHKYCVNNGEENFSYIYLSLKLLNHAFY